MQCPNSSKSTATKNKSYTGKIQSFSHQTSQGAHYMFGIKPDEALTGMNKAIMKRIPARTWFTDQILQKRG